MAVLGRSASPERVPGRATGEGVAVAEGGDLAGLVVFRGAGVVFRCEFGAVAPVTGLFDVFVLDGEEGVGGLLFELGLAYCAPFIPSSSNNT